MNNPNEQSTIERAAYALEQLTGKQVELKDDAPKVPPGTSLIADGTMVIDGTLRWSGNCGQNRVLSFDCHERQPCTY